MNGKDNEIEKLTQILSFIQELYYKKREQIDDLRLELEELRKILNHLNLLISDKSFRSADELYSKALKNKKVESYFKKNIPMQTVKGTTIKRKIFSDDNKELLCVLKFIDFNTIEIKFLIPEKLAIKETSEGFISILLKGALVEIKEENPELDLSYNYYKNTDIIEFIKIKGLKSIDDYDLITSKTRELIATKTSIQNLTKS
ncbi:MAG: hypothetical protein ACTSQJ_13430 [Promethearchaeota archaeon]